MGYQYVWHLDPFTLLQFTEDLKQRFSFINICHFTNYSRILKDVNVVEMDDGAVLSVAAALPELEAHSRPFLASVGMPTHATHKKEML